MRKLIGRKENNSSLLMALRNRFGILPFVRLVKGLRFFKTVVSAVKRESRVVVWNAEIWNLKLQEVQAKGLFSILLLDFSVSIYIRDQ